MSWYTIIATYVIIWGLVMFMALPVGVKRVDAEDLGDGDDPGAPEKQRLLLKMASATVITTVIVALIYVAAESGAFSFRE